MTMNYILRSICILCLIGLMTASSLREEMKVRMAGEFGNMDQASQCGIYVRKVCPTADGCRKMACQCKPSCKKMKRCQECTGCEGWLAWRKCKKGPCKCDQVNKCQIRCQWCRFCTTCKIIGKRRCWQRSLEEADSNSLERVSTEADLIDS